MKNTKKVLSVVLAVVMVLSALTLVAFAHTYTGAEVDDTVSVRYEVTQVASAIDLGVSGEEYTAVDNDIYAVTMYAKAPEGAGLQVIAAPLMYDQALFSPMAFIDEGEMYAAYPGFYMDVMKDADLQDFGFYSLPARFSDTNKYKADGTVTTSNVSAKVNGLGLGGLTVYRRCEDTGVAGYDDYTNGFPTGYGAIGINLTIAPTAKTAYLNTENGLLNCTDYMEMITVYFQRNEGVTEEQCYGAEFGIVAGTPLTYVQCSAQAAQDGGFKSGLPSAGTYINFINGAVESPVKPLVALTAAGSAKSQAIAFNLSAAATSPYDADDVESVDYRFVAQFSTTAFPIDYNPDGTVNSTDIDEVGYVMAKVGDATAAQLTAYDAAGIAGLSKDSGTIRKCWTAKISTDMAGGAAFAFSCRIKGIAVTGGTVASEYIVAPYVLANGQVYYGQAQTSTVQAKYDANIAKFLANKNA